MESYALDSAGMSTAGERGRKRKRAVVDSAIRNGAIKVGADRYGGRHVELKTADAHRVAVLVIAINTLANIDP